MLSETVKTNLNRIDYELKELYSNVNITEKNTHNKFYYQIEAVGDFGIFENQKNTIKSLVLIEKNNLNFDSVTWKYCVNPSKPNSEYIERVSKIDELATDIYNTITKKQMDINYLNSTPISYEMINESFEFEEYDIQKDILSIVETFSIEIEDATIENINGRRSLKIFHNGIKLSDKFRLESKINNLEGVDFISFNDDYLKVNFIR